MKARGPIEYRTDVPLPCVEMAKRRTQSFIDFYGRHIRSIDIETLVASAYLQGIEDMDALHEKQAVVNKNAIPVEETVRLLGLPGVSSGF